MAQDGSFLRFKFDAKSLSKKGPMGFAAPSASPPLKHDFDDRSFNNFDYKSCHINGYGKLAVDNRPNNDLTSDAFIAEKNDGPKW